MQPLGKFHLYLYNHLNFKLTYGICFALWLAELVACTGIKPPRVPSNDMVGFCPIDLSITKPNTAGLQRIVMLVVMQCQYVSQWLSHI